MPNDFIGNSPGTVRSRIRIARLGIPKNGHLNPS